MERPLKMLGLHDYRIRLHPEVAVTVTINVAQSAEEAEMQEQLGQAIIPSEGGEYEEEEETQGLATADIMDPPPVAEEEAGGESSDTPAEEASAE